MYVRVDPDHVSRLFVLRDHPVDFFAVRLFVIPGVDEVFGPQGRIALENISFADAETARLHQHPYGNASADNAGFAAADSGINVNSGRGVAKIARDSDQQFGLFTRCQGIQQPLNTTSPVLP
jgi:hypothetical protein